MNIGIDIDGVLTNDDDYILDCTYKYCYEHNLKGPDNPDFYEYAKFDWDEKAIDDYRKEYFLNYIKYDKIIFTNPPKTKEIIKTRLI